MSYCYVADEIVPPLFVQRYLKITRLKNRYLCLSSVGEDAKFKFCSDRRGYKI